MRLTPNTFLMSFQALIKPTSLLLDQFYDFTFLVSVVPHGLYGGEVEVKVEAADHCWVRWWRVMGKQGIHRGAWLANDRVRCGPPDIDTVQITHSLSCFVFCFDFPLSCSDHVRGQFYIRIMPLRFTLNYEYSRLNFPYFML